VADEHDIDVFVAPVEEQVEQDTSIRQNITALAMGFGVDSRRR
jgi:hypothetical protein